jgi:asparaginyl-tRNA synthetase
MGSGQKVEVKATDIHIYGPADPDKFPLQPKKHSMEFLREIAHLRPRTNTFAAVLRIRHALAFCGSSIFSTTTVFSTCTHRSSRLSDAEGAGEMFRVTTLDLNKLPRTDEGDIDFKQDFFRSRNQPDGFGTAGR